MYKKFLVGLSLTLTLMLAACASSEADDEEDSVPVVAQQQQDPSPKNTAQANDNNDPPAAAPIAIASATPVSSPSIGNDGADEPMPPHETIETQWIVTQPDDIRMFKESNRAYFAFDRSSVQEEDKPNLDTQAEYLRLYTDATVEVQGNTDSRGTREYNLALGNRRAISVKNYLILQGAKKEQIKTISYGEERPIAKGTTKEDYAMNRRTDSILIKEGKPLPAVEIIIDNHYNEPNRADANQQQVDNGQSTMSTHETHTDQMDNEWYDDM